MTCCLYVQNSAYAVRSSDCSSDECSSDLLVLFIEFERRRVFGRIEWGNVRTGACGVRAVRGRCRRLADLPPHQPQARCPQVGTVKSFSDYNLMVGPEIFQLNGPGGMSQLRA